MTSKWRNQSLLEPCLLRMLEKSSAEGDRQRKSGYPTVPHDCHKYDKIKFALPSPGQLTIPVFTIRDPSNILVVLAEKKRRKHFKNSFHVFDLYKLFQNTYRLPATSEQQCLAEITAQVMLTDCLHSEQVQDVRGHISDDCFLQEKRPTYICKNIINNVWIWCENTL